MADLNFTNPFLYSNPSEPRQEITQNSIQWHETEMNNYHRGPPTNIPHHVNDDATVSPKTIPRDGSPQLPATLNLNQDAPNRHYNAATRPVTLGQFVFRMEEYTPKVRYDLADFEAVPVEIMHAIATKYDHSTWVNDNRRVTLPPWLFPVPEGHVFQVDRIRRAEQQNMPKLAVGNSYPPYIPAGAMYLPPNRLGTADFSSNLPRHAQTQNRFEMSGSQRIPTSRLPSLEEEIDVDGPVDENFMDLLINDDT